MLCALAKLPSLKQHLPVALNEGNERKENRRKNRGGPELSASVFILCLRMETLLLLLLPQLVKVLISIMIGEAIRTIMMMKMVIMIIIVVEGKMVIAAAEKKPT